MPVPNALLLELRWLRSSLFGLAPAAMLFLLFVHAGYSGQSSATELQPKVSAAKVDPAQPAVNLENLSVDELINRLQEVVEGGEQMGLDQRIRNEFIVADLKSFYTRKNHGQPLPSISPVMRELVRRGLESLPKLLDHLDDKRPTRLVAYPVVSFVRQSFEPVRLATNPQGRQDVATFFVVHATEPNNPTGFEKKRPDYWRYPVRVGDLCYVAVGQIVNRNLRLIRKQEPTVCLNSPVHMPDVAAACRKEWAGLTPEKHKESLIKDCLDQSRQADPPAAMIRLYFYYPKEGEKIIIDHLRRPLSEEDVAFNYCHKKLLSITGDEYNQISLIFQVVVWAHQRLEKILYRFWFDEVIDEGAAIKLFRINHRAKSFLHDVMFQRLISTPTDRKLSDLLKEFANLYGSARAKEIPLNLSNSVIDHERHQSNNFETAVSSYKAKIILSKLFKNDEAYRHQFVNRSTVSEMDHFINDIPDYSNAKIDQAVYELFQRVSHSNGKDNSQDPWLARACVEKLTGKGHDPELRGYLEKRIEMTRKSPESPSKEWLLKRDQEALAKLKK